MYMDVLPDMPKNIRKGNWQLSEQNSALRDGAEGWGNLRDVDQLVDQ